MYVLKFGGSSVSTASSIQKVVNIISSYQDNNPIVVISAIHGITDKLEVISQLLVKKDKQKVFSLIIEFFNLHLDIIDELIPEGEIKSELLTELNKEVANLKDVCKSAIILRESSLKIRDYILSFGEKFSARIVNAMLHTEKIHSKYVSAEALICTDENFGEATPNFDASNNRINILHSILETNTIPVITGFIGSTRDYITTTLGRNGSDYSASILGALLKVKEIVIYTDVPGIFSTDPRLISVAEQITDLSYEEAFEMSYYGAKVLHPKTILPAAENHIPIRIKNTFDSENPGTLIKSESKLNGIKVINLIPNISIVNVLGKGMIGVPGISARTFNCARSVGANILMISQSAAEQKIGFVLRSEDTTKVINELNQEFKSESERKDISLITQIKGSILCCVGHGINENPLVLRQIFDVFEENNIKILMMVLGASEINLSMVLRKEDAERGLEVLHKRIMEQ